MADIIEKTEELAEEVKDIAEGVVAAVEAIPEAAEEAWHVIAEHYDAAGRPKNV